MAFFSHTLQSSNQIISSGDVVGILAYAASNESSNGDARLISGSIESVAEGDFTAVANPASLVFSTSTSADAVEQMRLTSEGYLGINTQYPTSELHVEGNTKITGAAAIHSAGTNRNLTIGGDADFTAGIQILGSGMSGGSEGLLIAESNAGAAYIYNYENSPMYFGTNAGYVGGWGNSGGLMVGTSTDSYGVGSVSLYANGNPRIKLNNLATGTSLVDGSEIYLNFADLIVSNREAGNIELRTNNISRILIQDDGDVGIGTSTPAYKLDVDGSFRSDMIVDNGNAVSISRGAGPTSRKLTVAGGTGDNSAAVLIQASGHNATGSDGFLLSNSNTGDAYIWNFENRPMVFATNNSEVMRFGSDGSLNHSGGTSATIGGASDYHIDVTAAETTIGGGRFQVKAGATVINEGGGNVDFRVEGDADPHLLFADASTDNVGIGLNTPIYKLDVGGDARILGNRPTIISGGSSYATTKQGSVGGWAFGHHALGSSGTDLGGFGWFGTDDAITRYYMGPSYSSTDGMHITSLGNVGVGTPSPNETLTVSGGLENLGGWKWFASSGSTVGQGPASGFLLQLNEELGNILSKAYHYTVRLSTNSTGTDTGASYLIWWNNGAATWDIRPIGQANNVSNHPMVTITNDGTNDRVRVYTDNATPYPIRCQVESLFHGDPDCKPHSMGADYQWQRLVNDLYHTEGNVGIGISTPALQSAGKGLHIDADGFHSEIKFTNSATGAAANQGVALVASNSSFTINNRSAGEVNINTNNLNAISINSAREVDIKQLLKVRLSNTVGTAGSINRISYYDDGTHSAGVGVSSGNVDYVAGGSVIQSFYTGGIKNLRLDPTGKVVMGAGSNVVAGDASLNYNVGICTNAATNAAIQVLKVVPDDGPTTFFNQYNRLTVPSGNPTAVRGIYQDMVIQNGADLSNIYGYTTGTATVNTGGNVNTVIGYYVNDVFLRGSASNYGIYSDVNEEETGYADKWGVFLAGTAPNYYRSGFKTSLSEGRHGSDNICERVAGGYKALGNSAENAGYLKIRLPEYRPDQKAGSTMMIFDVSMYEYKTGSYKNFHFGGYVYWNVAAEQSQWINTTATMEVDRDIDNANPWIVRFATDEDDYPCVLIGRSGENEATNWAYGQVYVQNVRTGFGRTAWDQWSQNWQISLETRDTTTGGYYNVSSGFINKPLMHNQVDYSITAGGTDISSPTLNKIIIDQNKTVFNENGVNADFRVESDANQHMIFVDASADSVGVGLSNPRADAQLHVGGPSSTNPTLMIGTGGNISSSICSLKFQDRGPAQDQNADGQITGYVQMERYGNTQYFDMTFGTANTTAGDAVERMRIDRDGLVGIGTNAPSKLLHVDNSGRGSGTSFLIQGDDDSYMSVQNSTSGDFLKLGNVYTGNTYMGLSHSDINNSGYMIMSNGVHTFLSSNTNGRVYIRGGRNDGNQGEIRIGDGLVQINPSTLNTDFRVCGDSVAELIRVDASKDSVLIGNSTDGGVNSRLYIYDDGAAKFNVTNSRTLQVQGRAYTTQSGTHYHIGGLVRPEKWISGGATDAGYCIGINAVPVVYSNSDDGANSLNELTAIRANMSINSSLADGANITNAYDIKCIPSLQGTNSTVTNHFGLYLTSATNGATTVTNAYGVVQEDPDATNLFVGNMTIGSNAAPDSFDGLTVYGNMSVKRQDGKVMAKDSTVVTKIQASTGAGGGLVGTESNHNLLIRTNNIDRARFLSSGGFQIGKGTSGFASPEAFFDCRGSAYFHTSVDAEALTFKKIPDTGPFSPRSIQEFKVGTLNNSLYIFHSENPSISGSSSAEVTCAIRMTQGKISMNAPPSTGLSVSHFPAFTVDTNTGRCTVEGDTLQIAENKTPSSSSDTGTKGDISWDDNYVYVCVNTNTWKRTAISTW